MPTFHFSESLEVRTLKNKHVIKYDYRGGKKTNKTIPRFGATWHCIQAANPNNSSILIWGGALESIFLNSISGEMLKELYVCSDLRGVSFRRAFCIRVCGGSHTGCCYPVVL